MPEIGSKLAKADIDMIDETFDFSRSENFDLFIQIGWNRLSFCIYDFVLNKFDLLRSYPLSNAEPHSIISECRAIFERDDLLGLRYKDSRNMLISPRCTLVPEHLFDENDADLYLTFNHGKAIGEQTLHNHIGLANAYNVFSYPEELMAMLQLYQPNIKLFHHATPLIETSVACMNTSDQINVCVYYYSGYLDITVIEKSKLLFYNTFQINAPEDAVYYYTLALNSLKIDNTSTKLIYAGNIKNMSPEISLLKFYVDDATDFDLPDVAYSNSISEPLRKEFINLFNLYRCE